MPLRFRSAHLLTCAIAVASLPWCHRTASAQEVGPSATVKKRRSSEAAAAALTWYGGQSALTGDMFPGAPDVVRNTHGAALDFSLAPREYESGLILLFSGAIERRADCAPRGDCRWPSGNGPAEVNMVEYQAHLPGSHLQGAWQGRLGYRREWYSLEAGFLGMTRNKHPSVVDREVKWMPEFALRLGGGPHFFGLGFASYNAPTLFGPAVYLQAQGRFSERVLGRFTLAIPAVEAGRYLAMRLDSLLMVRIADQLDVGGGLAFVPNSRHQGLELRYVTSYAF
ncbi:MAG: hypothetical protein HY898_12375 [Deltaproteobacteria bacterium]|nr:hypothetical protein [Deltaproteobacteria bacterium]